MPYWLLKTEPGEYSWEDLVKEGRTTWDGVKNALAQKNLQKMKQDDQVLIYHTGRERSIIGIAVVVKEPYPDDEEKGSVYLVDIVPLKKLTRPLSLQEIKKDPFFARWELVRLPRLSIMPVPSPLWEKILSLAHEMS